MTLLQQWLVDYNRREPHSSPQRRRHNPRRFSMTLDASVESVELTNRLALDVKCIPCSNCIGNGGNRITWYLYSLFITKKNGTTGASDQQQKPPCISANNRSALSIVSEFISSASMSSSLALADFIYI